LIVHAHTRQYKYTHAAAVSINTVGDCMTLGFFWEMLVVVYASHTCIGIHTLMHDSG